MFDNKEKKQSSVPKIVITIVQHDNGNVFVKGFPSHLGTALAIMRQADKAVIDYFVQAAKEGRLNDGGFVEQSKIIKIGPDKNIIVPRGNA